VAQGSLPTIADHTQSAIRGHTRLEVESRWVIRLGQRPAREIRLMRAAHDLLSAVHGAFEWSFCSGWTGKLFTRPATCNVAGPQLVADRNRGCGFWFRLAGERWSCPTLPSSELWCLNASGPSVAARALPEQSADATPDWQPCHPIVAAAVGGHSRAGCTRRRTGIEPPSRAVCGSPVLKTGRATTTRTPPGRRYPRLGGARHPSRGARPGPVTQTCPARGTTWLTRTGPPPTALAARPGPCPEPTAWNGPPSPAPDSALH
jgi:hypothetical protein